MSTPQPEPTDRDPLETMGAVGRRRFLGLAAFASASVIGVGIIGASAQAAAEPETLATPNRTDPDTGWPVFEGEQPPPGYVRNHLPCDDREYVDVPRHLATESTDGVTILKPPYQHTHRHGISGGAA